MNARRQRFVFLFLLLFSIINALALFFFSYTQIDLSLTLSEETIVQTIQKEFQYVGFYQRPLATGIYISVLLSMMGLYGSVLFALWKRMIFERHLWCIVFAMAGILLCSYSAAFSYDIFNYIFYPRMILVYGVNPFEVKPLAFRGIDAMLSFMRWTHVNSPYTPFWIFLSIVQYLLSFEKMLFLLWTMKIIQIGSYIGLIWMIGKILTITKNTYRLIGMASFAFHPLVIIEVLVSGHNDIVMMMFALLSYFLWLKRHVLSSLLFYSLSVATKFMTIILLPLFIIGWSSKKAVALMSLASLLVLTRREFLPWYWLWMLSFASLLPLSRLFWTIGIVGFILLFKYIPFLYFGIGDQAIYPQRFFDAFVALIVCSVMFVLFLSYANNGRRFFP